MREVNCKTFRYEEELMERKSGLFATEYLPNLEIDWRGLEPRQRWFCPKAGVDSWDTNPGGEYFLI